MKTTEHGIEESKDVENIYHMRLMTLLQELVREKGYKGAARVLEIDQATVTESAKTGQLTRRVRQALERALQEGVGSAAERQRQRNEQLEERVEGVAAEVKGVAGEVETVEAVEAVFAQARDAEATAEKYLVDDDWKLVEVEPEAVNGNGHHDDGIGPTVDLVLGNGRLPVNGNGTNGHHDEAPEPQQSLVSWAEFMAEEPVKPRGRKTQTPSLSLFEWAVEMEREEEPVGAGR